MIGRLLLVMALVIWAPPTVAADSINAHDFTFTSIDGDSLPLSRFKGKAVLVVNTASFCGYTYQYEGLQKLWERYRESGLVVLGVPSNDFGNQEPGTDADIKAFCEVRYIDFPLTGKVKVKGESAHPFYKWAAQSLGADAAPRWNFHKYLISAEGQLVAHFSSAERPESEAITQAVEAHIP